MSSNMEGKTMIANLNSRGLDNTLDIRRLESVLLISLLTSNQDKYIP
jgi:hypothetical protein